MKRIILYLLIFCWATIANSQTDISVDSIPVVDKILVADSIVVDSVVVDSVEIDTLSTLTVRERLEMLLDDELFRTTQVALVAYDLTADTVLFAHNERQSMRPASTMKLLTAITALDHLGDSYRYTTTLDVEGQILNNTLFGNVIIRGGMDPRFNTDDMSAFIETIQKVHIDTICGTIQEDRSFKDQNTLGEGWCWDDDNPVLVPLLWNNKDQFMAKFKQRLREANITILSPTLPQSMLRRDTLSSEEETFVERRPLCSRYHSIDQVLMRMMKESDNLYAESMFYQVASSVAKTNATAKDAIGVMKDLIKRIGLDPSDYRIADGSGLSLYNYQSAELLTHLLRYAFHNSNIYSHLYPSLPIAGVDGTLKKRMRGTKAAGNVHAKTGTLTGVSSLAGYLTAANGNTIAFAIINQGGLSSAKAKTFQDRVCTTLCSYQGVTPKTNE